MKLHFYLNRIDALCNELKKKNKCKKKQKNYMVKAKITYHYNCGRSLLIFRCKCYPK